MTVAALYVDPQGVYAGLPGVEVWDEARDARTYAGPWPVVAHPPCAAWCRWAGVRERDGYGKRGDDGGCFRAALDAVYRCGGVLEHPAHTAAWAFFGLPEPIGLDAWHLTTAGWVAAVDQAEWGLAAHKPTWLLFSGPDPQPLWGHAPHPSPKAGPKDLHSGHRHRTPPAFRDVLLEMARSAAPALDVERGSTDR